MFMANIRAGGEPDPARRPRPEERLAVNKPITSLGSNLGKKPVGFLTGSTGIEILQDINVISYHLNITGRD